MKTFIVLALIFTAVNSSFLRELVDINVSAVTIVQDCTVEADVTITATTDKSDLTGTNTFNITLTSGTEDITLAGTAGTAENAGKITWTFGPDEEPVGAYKIESIVDTTADTTNKFVIANTVTSTLTISVTATHNSTQEGTQEIEEGKPFNVLFGEDLARAPLIYSASNATTPIADCSVDEDDAKKVLCKPTKEEMKENVEYTIHYKSGCPATLAATKVKVKFTPKEDGSAFMTLGKVALFAIALLF